MSEWFDIYSLSDTEERQDLQVEGLRESVEQILDLVDQEIKILGREPGSLILGGISQGCAVAILALLAGRHRLGALFGFCTWLPFKSQLEELALARDEGGKRQKLRKRLDEFFASTLQLQLAFELAIPAQDGKDVGDAQVVSLDTPCFLSHCEDDEVVNIELGRELRDTLQIFGVAVTWDEHDEGGHWIQEPEGIDHLLSFISSHVQVLEATF